METLIKADLLKWDEEAYHCCWGFNAHCFTYGLQCTEQCHINMLPHLHISHEVSSEATVCFFVFLAGIGLQSNSDISRNLNGELNRTHIIIYQTNKKWPIREM